MFIICLSTSLTEFTFKVKQKSNLILFGHFHFFYSNILNFLLPDENTSKNRSTIFSLKVFQAHLKARIFEQIICLFSEANL